MDPNSRMDDVVWDGQNKPPKGEKDNDGCFSMIAVPVIALILAVILFCI